LGVNSGNVRMPNCVKGVVLCRFDLSFGPVPVIGYPPDFVTAEQSNRIAMRSMLRLSAGQEKAAVTFSTFDEIGVIGLGILGRLPTVGFYSLVVFFDLNVPKCISDEIDKVKSLLADINTEFPQQETAMNGFVKKVFVETQELVEQIAREATVVKQYLTRELEDGINGVASQVMLLIDECQKMNARPQKQFIENVREVASNLSLLAIKYDQLRAAQSSIDLLTRLERIRY